MMGLRASFFLASAVGLVIVVKPPKTRHHTSSSLASSSSSNTVEDPDHLADALKVVASELASNAARGSVAVASERKLQAAYDRKAEAEDMMRLAVEDVRAALRSELDAARDRAAETALSVEAYRHWETAKRNRAATERELMASLSSVATLTPEAEISDRLAAVADAKAEIIAVDSAIADELNDAIAFLEDAAETADHDRTRVERVLESLPDSAAEATAFRIFEWDDIDHARELVETARRRAALATEAARRLDQIIHKSTSLRSRAVTTVAGPAADDDDDDDLPTFKQAAKEVATAGLESAAAFGDWVLSDQPEELAQTIADRLRARVS